MYDIQHSIAVKCLTELCKRCDDSRLQSSMRGNFVVHRILLCMADKAFLLAEPCIKQSPRASFCEKHFCKKLKTYFFTFYT